MGFSRKAETWKADEEWRSRKEFGRMIHPWPGFPVHASNSRHDLSDLSGTAGRLAGMAMDGTQSSIATSLQLAMYNYALMIPTSRTIQRSMIIPSNYLNTHPY